MNFDGSYQTTMSLSQNVSVSGAPATMSWIANYNLGVRSGIVTIPIDLTTDFTFLETAGIFFGTGVDLNLGSSATYGGASGPVTATSSTSGLTTSNLFSGTGVLDSSSNSYAPSTGVMKAILGLHVNLWAVRLVLQGVANTNSSYSAYTGMHIVL